MSRIGEAVNRSQGETFTGHIDSARSHQEVLRGLDGKQACPFCGSVNDKSASPCARCGMDNTPEARKATKARIGPWYVLQARNPAAPGMRFETLLSFVRKGRVRARSVVRGPTTHQLWRFAAHVKGLSREFGLCFSCGSAIETTANVCPQCNRLQEPPLNPDILLEDGSEDMQRPVYRELPQPAPVAAEPIPAPAPPPQEAEIVIPALGGFEQEEMDPVFREGPPLTAPRPAAAVAAPAPRVELDPHHTAPSGSRPAPMRSPAADLDAFHPAASGSRPTPSHAPAADLDPFNMAVSGSRPAASRPAAPTPRPAPASSENPFAIPPARKKSASGEAATFLSAKELAAAFKLSFDPSADLDAVDVPDQMPASAMPEGMRPMASMPRNPMAAAPARQAAPAPVRSKRRTFARVALFILILGITGLGVLMWVDPGFRQQAIDWSKAKYVQLHGIASGSDTPAPVEAGFGADVPMPPEPTPSAVAKAPLSDGSDSRNSDVPRAADQPAPTIEAPAGVDVPAVPAPAPMPKSAPAPVPAPAQAEPAVVKEAAPSEAFDSATADAKRRTLYNAGIQAQGRGEFAKAIESYEAIQKLPEAYWPGDLETRLAYCRRQVK